MPENIEPRIPEGIEEVQKKPKTKEGEYGLYTKEIERSKKKWARFFDEYSNGEDRVKAVIEGTRYLFSFGLFDNEKMKQDIENLKNEEDREKFVEGVITAIKPVLNFVRDNPADFEALQRESFKDKNRNEVNEVFYYTTHGNEAHIHVYASKSLGLAKIKDKFEEGLRILAKDLDGNDEIKEIKAESWIIFEKRGLIEKYGFKIDSFDEKNKRGLASMSSKDFIAKYLNK